MTANKNSEDKPSVPAYTAEEIELLDKVAKKVVHWKMSVPAIMALESVKPLNYVSSQAMVFFEPIVQSVFSIRDYDKFRELLERRETIEQLLLRIEALDAVAARKEKVFNKLKKDYLRQQSWGVRLKSALLGFRVPKQLEEDWKARLDAIDAEQGVSPTKPTEGAA